MTRQQPTSIHNSIYYWNLELLDRLQRDRVRPLATPPLSFLQQLPASIRPADQSWTFQRTQLPQPVGCGCAFCIVNPLPQMANYTEAPGGLAVRPQGYDLDQPRVQQTGDTPRESLPTSGVSRPPGKGPTSLIAQHEAVNKVEAIRLRPMADPFISFGGFYNSYATPSGPDNQFHTMPPTFRGTRRRPRYSFGHPHTPNTRQFLPLDQGSNQYFGGCAAFPTEPHFSFGCNHVRHFPPLEDSYAAHSDRAVVRPFITQGQH